MALGKLFSPTSSIIWYRPKGGDALATGKVTTGLAESNGSLATAGFMASVTCGLTALDWDQLRNPKLVSNRLQ